MIIRPALIAMILITFTGNKANTDPSNEATIMTVDLGSPFTCHLPNGNEHIKVVFESARETTLRKLIVFKDPLNFKTFDANCDFDEEGGYVCTWRGGGNINLKLSNSEIQTSEEDVVHVTINGTYSKDSIGKPSATKCPFNYSVSN